jgi:hypothetical protein
MRTKLLKASDVDSMRRLKPNHSIEEERALLLYKKLLGANTSADPFLVSWSKHDIAKHTGLTVTSVNQLNFQCYLGGDRPAEGFYEQRRYPPVLVLASLIRRAERTGMTPQAFISWKNRQSSTRKASPFALSNISPDMPKAEMWQEVERLQSMLEQAERDEAMSEQRWRQHVQYLDKLTRNNPKARTTFANHLTQLGVSHELA